MVDGRALTGTPINGRRCSSIAHLKWWVVVRECLGSQSQDPRRCKGDAGEEEEEEAYPPCPPSTYYVACHLGVSLLEADLTY